MRTGNRTGQAGFAYIWLLFVVALLGVGAALSASLYSLDVRRDKEAELIRIGHEYRDALRSYYDTSPGPKKFPPSLDDLLRDPRFPGVKRHLRRIYPDPITNKSDWGVVRVGAEIVGIHSLSDAQPLKIANFDPDDQEFAGKTKYSEWVFVVRSPLTGEAAAKAPVAETSGLAGQGNPPPGR